MRKEENCRHNCVAAQEWTGTRPAGSGRAVRLQRRGARHVFLIALGVLSMVLSASSTSTERNLRLDQADGKRESALGAGREEGHKMGAWHRFCNGGGEDSRRLILVSIPSMAAFFFSRNTCLQQVPANVDLKTETCAYGALPRKMSFARQEDVQRRARKAALCILSTLDIGADSGHGDRSIPARPAEITRKFVVRWN